MPRYADTLPDALIAQVLTYVRSAWGHNAQPMNGNDVNSRRGKLHKWGGRLATSGRDELPVESGGHPIVRVNMIVDHQTWTGNESIP